MVRRPRPGAAAAAHRGRAHRFDGLAQPLGEVVGGKLGCTARRPDLAFRSCSSATAGSPCAPPPKRSTSNPPRRLGEIRAEADKLAPGSYGLVQVHDEDPVHSNEFRVGRLARGVLTEHREPLLAPVSPRWQTRARTAAPAGTRARW
ncbi:Imm7 family immunity protein [Amycolatopsis sp. NPDC049253]|uniref:Imm7 family immunity protein n=1 Tax=Amycolatopsis sp. NPDC049253 TaxID=3155274 RepID=UPI00343B8C8F